MDRTQWKIILFFCAIALLMLFCGCDLKDQDTTGYEPSCKVFINCLYLNQNNPDKSVCLSLAEGCKSANDFKACLNPVLKENRMEFKDCLLLMRK